MRTPDWDAYVRLAFEEIRLAGTKSPQLTGRLTAALLDLLAVAPLTRHAVLKEQLGLLRAAVGNSVGTPRDVAFASQPDSQGIGAAAGENGRSR